MRIMTLTIAAGLALGLQAGDGRADELQTADCETAERVAAAVDTEDREAINRWVEVDGRSTGLTLVAAVASPTFAETFGKPLLSWTGDDFTTFDRAMNQCIRTATAERRFDAQKRLIELRRVVKFHRGQPYNTVIRARERVAEHFETLQALPASATKLKVLALLARLGELDRRDGITEVRQPIERMGGAIELPAREVASNLHALPQAEADVYLERIRRERDALADAVLTDIRRMIEAAPASLAGLADIERALTGELGELRDLLPTEPVTELLAAAGEARSRAWDALEAQIHAIPASAGGSRQLDALTTSAAARSLGREDAARLRQLVQTRRGQVGNAAVAQAIDALDEFPDTLAGLRDFVSYAREQRKVLGRQVADLLGEVDRRVRQGVRQVEEEGALSIRGENEEALRYLETALRIAPHSREVQQQIAIVRERLELERMQGGRGRASP